jgi:hypothetical protein
LLIFAFDPIQKLPWYLLVTDSFFTIGSSSSPLNSSSSISTRSSESESSSSPITYGTELLSSKLLLVVSLLCFIVAFDGVAVNPISDLNMKD